MNSTKKSLKSLIYVMSIMSVLILTIIIIKNNDKSMKIGIIQFVEHDALDSSRNGFIYQLKKQGLNVKIEYRNAQGDQSNCAIIANQLVNKNCNLILAIATPAAQSVAAITDKIPILVTAITNPEDAGLVVSNKRPQTNVTGTSDLAPISQQILLIKKIKPDVKKIGILFSSNEANSKYQVEIAKKECEKLKLKFKLFNFSQMNEIQQIVESMVNKVDVIYTPTDNAIASNMELISKIALSKSIPVICGESNLLSKGATGTVGVDYYELGKLTADQAVQILKYGKKTQDIPIGYMTDAKLSLNYKILNKLGIKFLEKGKEEIK